MEKTIKYLENGEYHYATVRSVGDLAQLKTNSKETLVEAINELWNGGGNADPSKAPKPEGYDQLVQDVADAVKNQQEISQQWIEWQNEEAQLTEERKQAYLQAMKEMQEAIDKAKADAAALDDKTSKLDEQITKTFSELDTNIQNMHEQLQKEADRMNKDLQDTKGTLSTLRTDLQNTQMDNGRIHDELTNINGKFEHKVWQTDLDPLKEQIERAETSVQQTKDELLGKASRQDLDTVSNTVSKLDTQLKETAKGVEISVKKDELGGEIAEALINKTNILLGTRRFTTNNWTQRDHVEICSDPWKGFLVAKQNSPIEGIQQAYEAKAGTTYTFSLFAKMDTLDDSNKPQIILAKNNLDTSLDTKIDVWRKDIEDITSDFKRYDLTFTPSEDCTIYPHIISNSNNPIFVCGYQLEIGKTSTPWEPNQEDVGDYVEKSEAQFNVYNDKIQALTEKQRQQGDTQEQLRTEVTQTAEGVKQVSESLKNTNGDITKLRGDLERTADHMKSEYESYTNKAVGQISDSTLNLIRNSSFQNKDSDFDQWQNISAKANVRSDENGLRWVELTQSGLTTNNPEGITSNYFNIKQGKVTVAVDIKSGDKASLDNDSVLSLELYNDVKKRVDFYDVSLSQLGLSKELLGDHKVHRGLYRLGIDRNDAKYMTVKAKLVKNGDLYFTNFSARLSSIDDGAYEPNPDDLNQQILKQNTKIEQNAKEVAIKANSVDVTRDIKSAVDGIRVGGVNLAKNTGKPFTMGYCIPNTTWKDNSAYLKLPTTVTGGEILPQGDNTFQLLLEKGKTYTQTIWVETDANVKDLNALQFTWFTFDGHDFQPARVKKIGDRLYKLYSTYTWPGKKDNNVRLFDTTWLGNVFNLTSSGSYLKFLHPQIEYGNQSTDWSQSPEDISTEIKSAKDAAIQVASGQINLRVNELSTQFDDKLNKRINEQKTASEKFTSDGIEQVVTKITNVKGDVDRLGDTVNRVGSRNLLHNTSDQWRTLTNDGDWLQKTTASSCWTSTSDYHGGNKFTYAAKITNNSHQQAELEIWLCDQNKTLINGQAFHAPIPKGANAYDVNVTFPITTGTWYIRSWIIFTGGHAPKGDSVQVKDERLVEGATPGSWSPNPEDINRKIDTQTLDSANIDEMKTQGHYFVRNLTGNPIGGWVYVDVTGNNNDRIRQDVYADQNNQHKYRSWNGSRWSGWEQGAYISDVNNVKTEVTASVKNLGDRVTTQVNSIKTKVDNMKIGGRNLLKGTRDFNSKYWYQSGDHTALADNPTDSSTKEIHSWLDWHSYRYNQTIQLDSNKDYMVSADIAIYDGNGDGLYVTAYGTLDGTGMALTNDVNLSGFPKTVNNEGFRRIYLPLKKRGRNLETFRIEGHGNWAAGAGSVFISKIMLYEGNTPLAWADSSDDFVEAIKEVNTKWDVANGQIQGKVTATEVNNILNGKGYATQSWAQTMFQMKSNSITLQAVRDNITNGIQNQVNDTKNQVNAAKNQISGLQNASRGDLSNICRNPNFMDGSTAGWQGVTASTGNGSSPAKYYGCIQQRDAYYGDWFTVAAGDQYFFSIFAWQDTSPNHFNFGFVYEQTDGHWNWNTSLTFTPTDHLKTKRGSITIPNNVVKARIWVQIDAQSNFGHWYFTNVVAKRNDAISAINITPDQIKIASNKIVIDGNTDIHGVLRVPDVKLAGRNGNVDLSGDGINITKTNGAGINIASNGIQLMANTNGQNEIEGVITTAWSMNNKNQNGIGLVITPEQTLGRPYGGDILTIGEMVAPGTIHAGMVFDATGINPDYKKGFNWFAPHTLNGDGGVLRFPGAQDDLMLYPGNMPGSRQSDCSQPTLRLVHGNSQGSAGIQFQWNDIVPFGRITSSMSYVSAVGTDDDGGITVSWYSYGAWYGGRKAPSIVYRGSDGKRGNGGIVFYPYGEVCFWQGDFHSNLRWSGMKNTD